MQSYLGLQTKGLASVHRVRPSHCRLKAKMIVGFSLTKKVAGQKQKPWPGVAERTLCLMLKKQKALSSSAGVTYKQTEQNPSGFW